jgi:hypothetical protein
LPLSGGGRPAGGGQVMSYFSKRALRWAAPVVLVGALGLAACGDSDDVAVRTRAPAAPSAADVAGSDQHLNNLAEQARQARADAAASARLQGQAEVYQSVEAAAVSGQAELVDQQSAYQAGSRPNVSAAYLDAQRAAADGYVEQLEARAASAANAYGDEQRDPMSANEATTPSPVDPDEAEREAHLDGQAQTYGPDQ